MACVLSEEFEENLKEDCNKLYLVLKNCENLNDAKEAESLKILYRIIYLISYRQSSKMAVLTNYTVKYLCQHPMLPLVLVEILRESFSLKICTYVLEILAKLVTKNLTTAEMDRKIIRRVFADPSSFKLIVEAFQKMYQHFVFDKTNPLFYEVQLRLLKVINCLFVRKGSNQISLLSPNIVEFFGRHLTKYKAHKEISQNLLPILKVLCRNKKYSFILCNENFLLSLTTIIPLTNKYQAAITILKLLTRCPDAINEMSKCEKLFYFIITIANNQEEKVINKKHLITTLYRISKPFSGMQIISIEYLWLSLLDVFLKTERLEELKQRLIATKACTILNRGVSTQYISVSPLKLKFNFSDEIRSYVDEKSNHHCDDSDNEESEDEDEPKENVRERALSEDNDSDDLNSDSEEYFDENGDDDCCDNIIEDLNYMKKYYQEIFIDHETTFSNFFSNQILKRHKIINRQAFPDAVLAESDKNDGSYITASINSFSVHFLSDKFKVLKGLQGDKFKRRVIYDLDELIRNDNDEFILPNTGLFGKIVQENLNSTRPRNYFRTNSLKSIRFKSDPPALQFESRFECGNLRRAEQIGDWEYNLFLSPDINMTNGLQWFYFQVSNMVPGETYTLNIVNFQKVNSQFNYGLQPVMFSVIDYLIHSTGWRKIGEKIVYYGNEFVNKDTEKQFRTLSFCISFQYSNDYCYLAYHFPYTYTRLVTKILPFVSNINDSIYSRVDKLTDTVNGLNEVPLITVTARVCKNLIIPLEKRPLVFITARVHPGESNSSWIMDGILQFLLDEYDESVIKAREQYVFKIIPMLNPEGVIYGNSRCGLTGNDLNRCWKKPHPVLHPEIYYAKKLVQFAKDRLGQTVFAFIDIHGHSRKKFFFLYGCNPKQSWNDNDKLLADSSETTYNLLPKALSTNENIKMSYCRYNIERQKESTCRVVMWREFGIKLSYTLECSFCSGENKKKMTTHMLRDVGISIIKALANISDTG